MDYKDDHWRIHHATAVALLPYRKYNTTFFYQRVGQVIRDIRKERRITQEELSALLKWRNLTLFIVEQGHQEIPLHMYCEICKVLDITLSDLVSRSEKYTQATLPKGKTRVRKKKPK